MSVIINLANGLDPIHAVKIMQGESFTVPRVSTVVSPTTQYLAKSLDSVRETVGGQILFAFNDAAGGELTQASLPAITVRPGDVIACSAVASSAITVTQNGATIMTIAATAVGGILLVYM